MIRASDFWRVRNCPASVALSQSVEGTAREAPRESDIASRGTQEHAEAAADKGYLNYVATKELSDWSQGEAYELHREKKLILADSSGEPCLSGHPDRFSIMGNGDCLIQELKTGPLLELDYWTDQLHAYELLVRGNYEVNKVQKQVVSKFHGVLEIGPSDAPSVELVIHAARVAKGAVYNAHFHPGRWCRYCPARLACAFAEQLPIEIASNNLPVGEKGAEMLSRLKVLKSLVEEKIEFYEDLVRQNPATLGNKWRVDEGKRIGKITDLPSAIALLAPHVQSARNLLSATSTISYAKCRDWIAEQHSISKKDAEAALADILGDLLTFSETKGSVVEVSPNGQNPK
jgi:hypothetical protein